MHLSLRKSQRWPYASGSDRDSIGTFLGSVRFGIFHGRMSCWEATGEARQEFNDKLGVEVAQYLDENSELPESGSYFHISLYMVGKSPARAKPTIMFVSGDKRVRRDAFKMIQQSGKLAAYPGFALAHIPLEVEYRNFQQLAGGDSIEPAATAIPASAGILTTRHGNFSGRRLYFPSPCGKPSQGTHTATAGGVVSFKGRRMFFTVCHGMSDGTTNAQVASVEKAGQLDEDEDLECGEITGFDEVDLEEPAYDDSFIATTSRGSATPESSRSDVDGSSSVCLSTIETIGPDDHLSAIQTRLENLAQILPIPEPPHLTRNKTTIPAGEVVLSSPEFDCLLIDVNSALILAAINKEQAHESCIPLENYRAHVESKPRDAVVKTTTPDGGTIAGALSGTPSFVRLPFSKKFHRVYTAKFHRPLVPGDCGSWVRDATTGRLFGHIIAGSPTTGLVKIMPAHQVFSHLLSTLEAASTSPVLFSVQPSRSRETSTKPASPALSAPKKEPVKTTTAGVLRRVNTVIRRKLQRDRRVASRPDDYGVVSQAATHVQAAPMTAAIHHPPQKGSPPSEKASNRSRSLTNYSHLLARPVELDAGPVHVPVRLQLTLPVGAPAAARELAIYRETLDGLILRVDEETPDRKRDIRHLDLRQDSVLPLYTLAAMPRDQWHVEFRYAGGLSVVSYSLREKEDMFRLQSMLTGYMPSKSFENVSCALVFKTIIGRDRYEGRGVMQLWWPETTRERLPQAPDSRTAASSGDSGIQEAPSTFRTVTSGVVAGTPTISVNHDVKKWRNMLTLDLPRPPLLVAFLRDKKGKGYTMLRTELTYLERSSQRHDTLELHGFKQECLLVKRLSVPESKLDLWNLCAFDVKGSTVTSLRGTLLSLTFAEQQTEKGQATPAAAVRDCFERELLLLQARRRRLEAERRDMQYRVEKGSSGRSNRMSIPTPLPTTGVTPSSAVSPRAASRGSWPRVPPPAVADSAPVLPLPASAGQLSAEVIAELEYNQRSVELPCTQAERVDGGPARDAGA